MKPDLRVLAILLILFALLSSNTRAQNYSITIKQGESTTSFGGKASLKVSQAYFSKWAAGGQDLINFLGNLFLVSKYVNTISEWENNINLVYGSQALEHKQFRKTDDNYEFNSKYGLKTADPRLLVTLALQFKSQFTNGYTYDDKDVASLASSPFAPAYLTGYLGLDYKPIDGLSIFLSPFTAKTTIVANSLLSSQGAYGVPYGNTFLQAYGANLTISLNKAFNKYVILSSKLDLFSNYINVSSVVVNWDNSIDIKVTKLLAVSLSTGIAYDENVKWKETATIDGQQITISNKPQLQYKQLLSIGFLYSL